MKASTEGAMRRPAPGPERGATTVEFAVLTVLLLVVLFGILEFGLLFFQNHFVPNAPREGLRVGVVANNYACFDGAPADGCSAATDRRTAVDAAVRGYLAALYDAGDIVALDILSPESAHDDVEHKPLTVTVTVANFYPTLIAAFIPGYTHPETITFTATGEYEDPREP